MPPSHQTGLTSVIVVTADSGPLVAQCVERVLVTQSPLELILVDNASTDGQIEAVLERHARDQRLHVLRNAGNLGFGPACNRGAREAHGDALLFLNPDCLLASDSVARLREVISRHAQAGIVGAHVRKPDGSSERAIRRRDPTLRRSLMSLSGLARLEQRWPALAGVDALRSANASDIERVEAISGACMFMPREAFDRVGGFDEGYFLHCEDLDLCRRTRDAGYDVLLASTIDVCHEQGSSSRRRPLFVSRHKHRGMWRYFRRFDPAARNPLLRWLVACGIWGHFAVLAPRNAWHEWRVRINP